MARKKKFSATKEIKAIARERIGRPKPARPIEPKAERKLKHKKKDLAGLDGSGNGS